MPLANEQGAAILSHPSELLEVSGASQGLLHILCLTLSRAQEPKHAPTSALQIDGLSEKTKTRNLRGPRAACPAPTLENPGCPIGSDFHMAPAVPPPPAVEVDPPPMEVWPEDPVCQLEIGETVEAFWEPEKQCDARADRVVGLSLKHLETDICLDLGCSLLTEKSAD